MGVAEFEKEENFRSINSRLQIWLTIDVNEPQSPVVTVGGSVTDTLCIWLHCTLNYTLCCWWHWLQHAVLVWPASQWHSCGSVLSVGQPSVREAPVNIYYAARILWILNTYRPRIHMCGTLTAYQNIQQTQNSGQRWFSLNTIPESRLLHSSLFWTMPTVELNSQMSTVPILDLWIVRKSTCLQYHDHHFSQSGRSVTPFQPSWEC